ncbi:MAG TPA: iron donor protein CyaY [Candidatus Binataceae bacterium]|nr:iron donor protein CyaY [Candidatus Binataceae bacterium]
MEDRDFQKLADSCLARVAKWLEGLDPDEADYSTADGSVTIEFADGMKFILSRQSATNQIWLAAAAHGYHYDYDADRGAWFDDKDRHELHTRIAELVAEQVGHPVQFDA